MKTPAPNVPSRRDRERETHRREILEAAERVFAVKGYEAATVEEIAREARQMLEDSGAGLRPRES
jgi:AcrR family transcriptional regulator